MPARGFWILWDDDQAKFAGVWKRGDVPSSDVAVQAYRLLTRASSLTNVLFVILIRAVI